MSGRLSHRDLTILGAVLVLGVAAALWWLLVAPARSDAADRGAQLAAVEHEVNQLNDTLARLRDAEPGAARRTAERLRLAKALPGDLQVPAVILQLQRTAERAGVEFTALASGASASLGAVTGTEFQLTVTGRFHDVDDFLYRMHALVTVTDAGDPEIEGRLIAVRTISLNPAAGSDRTGLRAGDRVTALMTVVAYSAPTDGDPAATSARNAPGTTTPATTTPATTTPSTTDTAPGPAAAPAPAGDGTAAVGDGG